MKILCVIAIVLGLVGCGGNSSTNAGYAYECLPAAETNPACQKAWVPTVLDGGESVSLGFSGPARVDLADSVDFRHDDWDAEDIAPDPRPYFYAAVVSHGINDGNSLQLLQRMEVALNDRFYSVIVLNSVTHDITLDKHTGLPEVGLADYRANVEALAQLAEQHASSVIWLNTPPIPEGSLGPEVPASEVQTYNAAADEVAHAHGFYVLDVPGTDHLPGANVHYTGEGYDILGKEVADCVLTALEDSASAQCHR